VKAKIKNDGR